MDRMIFEVLHAEAGIRFASVLLIVSVFLVARVAHQSQPRALLLALTPMAVLLAANLAMVAA